MNSRRVQNSISSLDKDITHCEEYLSKVLKGKIDKQKSSPVKSSQYNVSNGVREKTVMPFITQPSTTMSTKQVSKPKLPKPSFLPAKHVVCKEVFENNNATVEVTVKTKTSGDKSRKRPRSNTLGSAYGSDGILSKDELLKQSNVIFEPPAPSKQNRNVSQRRTYQTNSRHKHPSWANILKQRNAACIVHSDGYIDEIDSRDLYPKGRRSGHRYKRSHKCMVSDDSFTTTTTNGSPSPTSDQESLQYVSRSTQCQLSECTGRETKATQSTSWNTHKSDGGTFSMFNPVRSLNFLIKELRGKMQKSDTDENMQRIIADMELALMRIPSEVETNEKKGYANEAPTRDETTPRHNEVTPLKPTDAALSKPTVMPKVKFAEQQSTRHDKNDTTHHDKANSVQKSSGHSHKSITPPVKERSEKQVVKKELELKCAQLEVKCTQMELAQEHHKKEMENLHQKIESKQKEVQEVSSREKDYLTTISYLKANLESMTKRTEEFQQYITELNTLNSQLKEENKSLHSFRDSQGILTKRLRESTEEGEKVNSQLQMMKLEREKYKILMDSKNKEIEKFRQELREIQTFASEQIMNGKTFAMNSKNVDAGQQSILKHEISSDSVDTELNFFLNNAWKAGGGGEKQKQPICSSPTSSLPSSVEIYPSWQKISRISNATQRNANKTSTKDVIVLSPAENSTVKESDSDLEGLIKPSSPDFKSFLVDSLSRVNESSRTEPKSCQELKDDLRNLFDRIKKQTKMGSSVTLPSPPHQYSEIEPCGMSQWSDFSGDSNFCSASNTETNKRISDLNASDLSIGN